jgi:hypothetical protein
MVTLPGSKSRYEAGERAGDYVARLADGAANFACGIYRDFPGALINPVPIPFRDVGAGFMDSLCGRRSPGLPIPQNPGFVGGQCLTTYTVTTQRVFTPPTGGQPTISGGTSTITGRLIGLQFTGLVNNGTQRRWVLVYSNAAGTVLTSPVGDFNLDTAVSITNIVRTDGQPDNCGNRPPGFPDSSIPPDRGSGNVTINNNDGTSINIPIVYAPITPTLNITPSFAFNLGGLDFNFNLGGVTISNPLAPNDPINRDFLPPGSGDVINNIGGDVTNLGDSITNLGDTINNINDVVNDIKEAPCECPEFNPDEIIPDPKTEDDPKEEEGDPTIESVEVTLTSVPRNARSQFGSNAPNVIYAGWFEWKRGEFCFPREPIHFKQSIFKNLVDADGFAYTVYEGFRAKHTINRSPNEPD